jgi:hypothetical protein
MLPLLGGITTNKRKVAAIGFEPTTKGLTIPCFPQNNSFIPIVVFQPSFISASFYTHHLFCCLFLHSRVSQGWYNDSHIKKKAVA